MNILLYSQYQYPAKGSAGSERVVERLARGFIKLGHKVYLHCYKGSTTDIKGLQLVHDKIPDDVDIIHVHGFDLDSEEKYGSFGKPYVGTLHGGGSETDERWLGHKRVICVSKFVSDRLKIPAYVNTCVSPEEFCYQEKKHNYFLYLAGFGWGWNKGLGTFIQLARRFKQYDFHIAGAGNNTFGNEVKKILINDRNIKFIGEINGQTKAVHLAGAKALLNPTLLQEAGQSTLPEALISGTPIIGSRNGCLPEIIEQYKVGYCCRTEAEYMKAIMNIDRISPEYCRQVALDNFTDTIACQKHLMYYSNIITKGSTV